MNTLLPILICSVSGLNYRNMSCQVGHIPWDGSISCLCFPEIGISSATCPCNLYSCERHTAGAVDLDSATLLSRRSQLSQTIINEVMCRVQQDELTIMNAMSPLGLTAVMSCRHGIPSWGWTRFDTPSHKRRLITLPHSRQTLGTW